MVFAGNNISAHIKNLNSWQLYCCSDKREYSTRYINHQIHHVADYGQGN